MTFTPEEREALRFSDDATTKRDDMDKPARRHWDLSQWEELGPTSDDNLITHVWPGGYPVVYVNPEDETKGLCVETVREMLATGEWPEGKSVDSYTHYEGSPVECSCGKSIESAYGEPTT